MVFKLSHPGSGIFVFLAAAPFTQQFGQALLK